MLSPDVPEFIPKGMRGPGSSNSTISVANLPTESRSQSNTHTVSKSFQKANADNTAHIDKGNSEKDEHRTYSHYNSGRNTKSWQNRNSFTNLGQHAYTKVLSINEPPHKSTVASRMFKEQHQEELWPSLPGLEKSKSLTGELKGNKKSEARSSSFPAQVNVSRENLTLEQSNIWQVRKTSNVQQNVVVNKDHLNHLDISNDSNKLSNAHVSSKEVKIPHTNPITKKSRKIDYKKKVSNENVLNENTKHEKPRKHKSESIIKDVNRYEPVSQHSATNMQHIKSESISQHSAKNMQHIKSESVSQQSETNMQHIKSKSVTQQSETNIQQSSDIQKSNVDTDSVITDLPGQNEDWQIQKDRKRKKHSKDKQKNPGACEKTTENSNILLKKRDGNLQYRNRDGSNKGKDKEEAERILHQNHQSNYRKINENENNQIENGKKNKTKREVNAQYAQERIRNKKEMGSTDDKFKRFDINNKDRKDNKTEICARKYDENTNVIKDKNVKSKKITTQQFELQENNLKSDGEQEKCETKKGNDNSLSKQMSSEEFEKFKAERKMKRKEEKIRKRELRLRKEMAMTRGDSKVMVITREFLEAMTSKSSSSSHMKKEVKETFTDIDNDYPTLDVGDGFQNNEVKIMTNKLKEASLTDIKCEEKVEVNKENQCKEIDVGLIAQEPTFSYSSALLTTRKKIVTKSLNKEMSMNESNGTALLSSKKKVINNSKMKERATNESKIMKNNTLKSSDTAAPQKKIKMKDAIEFDLMAAIGTRTTKQKKKISEPRHATVGILATKNKGVVALGSKIRGATAAAQPKRGKQREDQNRKKKISVLKKRMKENQGIDGQSLVGILLEAKKFRDEDNSIVKASSNDNVDISKESTIQQNPCPGNTDFISCNSSTIQLKNTNLDINLLENLEETEGSLQRNVYETKLVDSDSGLQQPDVTSNSIKLEDVVPLESVRTQHPLQKLSQEVSEKCKELALEIMELQDPVHKNSFREYCNHVLTPELDTKAQALIEALVRFQERQYLKDPVKARIRRRYVCGLKETIKLMGKMSCILVAPDITRSKGPGALDERVEQVLSRARESAVPVIFVLSKRKLGKISRKKGTVSCFGIINYQGAQDFFNEMMELVPAASQQYEQLVAQGRLIRPTPDSQNMSDDEEDILVSLDVVKESNDSNCTDGYSKEILDINKKIIDSLSIKI